MVGTTGASGVGMVQEKRDVRCVKFQGSTYVHLEDICALLVEFAATEETDARNRLNKLVQNLKKGA